MRDRLCQAFWRSVAKSFAKGFGKGYAKEIHAYSYYYSYLKEMCTGVHLAHPMGSWKT